MAPLLPIAPLCIVAGGSHGATPPHRSALHRRRRVSWRHSSSSLRSASSPAGLMAPLLLIAPLCIVAGGSHGATPPHRSALHRRRRDASRLARIASARTWNRGQQLT